MIGAAICDESGGRISRLVLDADIFCFRWLSWCSAYRLSSVPGCRVWLVPYLASPQYSVQLSVVPSLHTPLGDGVSGSTVSGFRGEDRHHTVETLTDAGNSTYGSSYHGSRHLLAQDSRSPYDQSACEGEDPPAQSLGLCRTSPRRRVPMFGAAVGRIQVPGESMWFFLSNVLAIIELTTVSGASGV